MQIADILVAIQERTNTPSSTCPASSTYKCDLCHDTGWIQIEMPSGYTGVRECACVKARKAERLMARSGLKDVLDVQTFDAFKTETETQRHIKSTAERYLKALLGAETRRPWFYIGGNPGSGKTHICTAICGELLRNNIGVVYMQWLDEVRKLKAFINEPDFDSLLDKYIQCEVLYIDDLFKQTYRSAPVLGDADIRMAFSILNARYLQNKATIISGEWDIMQLINADEGVFSRVYERSKGYVVSVARDTANNYRLRMGA